MSYHDTECPYCTRAIDICHDDGQGYAEDEIHEQECEHCGKTFVFTTMIHFSYNTKKAPCLNGEEHEYRDSPIYPFYPEAKRCKHCGHEERGKYVEFKL